MKLSVAVVYMGTVVFVGLGVLTACGSVFDAGREAPRRVVSDVVPPKIEVDPSQAQTVLPEETVLAPEQRVLQGDVRLLTESLNGNASLVSVAPDTARGIVVIYWHGPDTRVADRSAKKVTSPVEVRSALYAPADLQAAADYLITQVVGFRVGAVGVALDGSGLQVSVHRPSDEVSAEEIGQRLSRLIGFPVIVNFDVPVAIPG